MEARAGVLRGRWLLARVKESIKTLSCLLLVGDGFSRDLPSPAALTGASMKSLDPGASQGSRYHTCKERGRSGAGGGGRRALRKVGYPFCFLSSGAASCQCGVSTSSGWRTGLA